MGDKDPTGEIIGAPAWEPPKITNRDKFESQVGAIKDKFREQYGATVSDAMARRVALGDPNERGRVTTYVKTLKREKEEHTMNLEQSRLTGDFFTGELDPETDLPISVRTIVGEEHDRAGEEAAGYTTIRPGYFTIENTGSQGVIDQFRLPDGTFDENGIAFIQQDLKQRGYKLSGTHVRELAETGTIASEIRVSSLTARQVEATEAEVLLAGQRFELDTEIADANEALAWFSAEGTIYDPVTGLPEVDANGDTRRTVESRLEQLQWIEEKGEFADGSPTLQRRLREMDNQTKRDIIFGYDEKNANGTYKHVMNEAGHWERVHVMGQNELQMHMQKQDQAFTIFMADGGSYIDNDGNKQTLIGHQQFESMKAERGAALEALRREGGEIVIQRTGSDGIPFYDTVTVMGTEYEARAQFTRENITRWRDANHAAKLAMESDDATREFAREQARLDRLQEWLNREDVQRHDIATITAETAASLELQDDQQVYLEAYQILDHAHRASESNKAERHDEVMEGLRTEFAGEQARLDRLQEWLNREDVQRHSIATITAETAASLELQDDQQKYLEAYQALDRALAASESSKANRHDMVMEGLRNGNAREMLRLDKSLRMAIQDDAQRHAAVTATLAWQRDMIDEYGGMYLDETGAMHRAPGSQAHERALTDLAARLDIDRMAAQEMIDNRAETRSWSRELFMTSRQWGRDDTVQRREDLWQSVERQLDRDLQLTLQADRITSAETIAANQLTSAETIAGNLLDWRREEDALNAKREQWAGIMDLGFDVVGELIGLGDEKFKLFDAMSWTVEKWNALRSSGDVAEEVYDKVSTATSAFTSGVPTSTSLAASDPVWGNVLTPSGAGVTESSAATAGRWGASAEHVSATVPQTVAGAAITVYLTYRFYKNAIALANRDNGIDNLRLPGAREESIRNWDGYFGNLGRNDAIGFRDMMGARVEDDGETVNIGAIFEDGHMTDFGEGSYIHDNTVAADKPGRFSERLQAAGYAPTATGHIGGNAGRSALYTTDPMTIWGKDRTAQIIGADSVGESVRFFMDHNVWKMPDGSNRTDFGTIQQNVADNMRAVWEQLPWRETSVGLDDPAPGMDAAGLRIMADDLAAWGERNGIMSSAEMAESYETMFDGIINADSWEAMDVNTANGVTAIWEQATGERMGTGVWHDGYQDADGNQVPPTSPAEKKEYRNNVLRMMQNRRTPDENGVFFVMPESVRDIVSPNGIYQNTQPVDRSAMINRVVDTNGYQGQVFSGMIDELDALRGRDWDVDIDRLLSHLVLPKQTNAMLPQDLEAIFGPKGEDGEFQGLAWDIFKGWADNTALLQAGTHYFGPGDNPPELFQLPTTGDESSTQGESTMSDVYVVGDYNEETDSHIVVQAHDYLATRTDNQLADEIGMNVRIHKLSPGKFVIVAGQGTEVAHWSTNTNEWRKGGY